MSIQQELQNEIEDSKRWIECTQEDSTYKRDLYKRIELINWVLEKMNNPDIQIYVLIETKMNEFIDRIRDQRRTSFYINISSTKIITSY
jgi:hypothetical protein